MNPGTTLEPTFDTRRRGVLAFTCAVHLLALLLCMQERRPPPARPSRVVTFFLQAAGSQAARPPSRTDPHSHSHSHPHPAPSRPAAALAPAVASRVTSPTQRAPVSRPEIPIDTRTDTRAQAAPAQAVAMPDAPTPAPDLFDTARPTGTSASTPAGSAPTRGGVAAGLATHQAGRIDHELRKGKPGVPDEADTPWARFQRGLESAHVDRTLTWQSDTYTSPDGVIIYRFRQGNRVRCRRAGSVGMPLRGFPDGASATMANAGSAAETDCPKGVTWHRDDP